MIDGHCTHDFQEIEGHWKNSPIKCEPRQWKGFVGFLGVTRCARSFRSLKPSRLSKSYPCNRILSNGAKDRKTTRHYVQVTSLETATRTAAHCNRFFFALLHLLTVATFHVFFIVSPSNTRRTPNINLTRVSVSNVRRACAAAHKSVIFIDAHSIQKKKYDSVIK